MSNSNFETLKLELSLLGMKVPDVVAVLQDEVRELLISKNAEVQSRQASLSASLINQQPNIEVWESAYGDESMTPDQCFDEMALALGLPEDTGYIVILESVKKLTLACLSANSGLDDLREARDKRDLEIKELKEEIKELRGESVEVA